MGNFWIFFLVFAALAGIVLGRLAKREDSETGMVEEPDDDCACCFTCASWEMLPDSHRGQSGVCTVKSSEGDTVSTPWDGRCDAYKFVEWGDPDEHHTDALL